MSSVLFGVEPLDTMTVATVVAALAVAGAAAMVVPVARALRADPARELRNA